MATSFLDLGEIIQLLDIKPGQLIADFGAGSGFWALTAARQTGPSGIVYALDIQEQPLEIIRKKARELRLANLRPEKANLEKLGGSGLNNNSCDWVFLINVLFQNERSENLLAEARRILKPRGRVLVIDREPEKIVGIKKRPLSSRQIKEIFRRLGLTSQKEFSASQNHFGLIFSRPTGLKKLFSLY